MRAVGVRGLAVDFTGHGLGGGIAEGICFAGHALRFCGNREVEGDALCGGLQLLDLGAEIGIGLVLGFRFIGGEDD